MLTVSALGAASACGSADDSKDAMGGEAGMGGAASGGEAGGEASGGSAGASGGSSSGGKQGSGGKEASGGEQGSGGTTGGEDCGNGKVDPGEECDPGRDACCAEDCSGPASAKTICRPSADGCEVEELCDGESLTCPADLVTCAELTLESKTSTSVVVDVDQGCDVLTPSCLESADSGGSEVVFTFAAPEAGDYTFLASASVPVVLSAQRSLSCTPDELACARSEDQASVGLTLTEGESIRLLVEPVDDTSATVSLSVRPTAPAAFSCNPLAYGDGTCDCGCGASDIDCVDASIDSCESNSCGATAPDPDETTQCGSQPPSGWTCDALSYVDGACDCGCGRIDPACASNSVDSCDRNQCPLGMMPAADRADLCVGALWNCEPSAYGDGTCDCGCGSSDVDCESADDCETSQCEAPLSPDPTDPGLCTEGWTCDADWFGDGRCDCGCGALDSDCASASALSCYYHSCTSGTPAPNNNTICMVAETSVPEDWSCGELFYSDGVCDCGCGTSDPDCATSEAASCQRVNCADTPLDTDTTQCQVFPNRWFCAAQAYYDPICDCGCGMPDPACDSADSCGTDVCPTGSPDDGTGRCDGVPDGWQCAQDLYADGTCSCGCGAQDQDCATLDATSCEEEICGSQAVVNDNNATCETVPTRWDCLPQLYYDDVCDCGCGAPDPECSAEAPTCDRNGCIPPSVVDDTEIWACASP